MPSPGYVNEVNSCKLDEGGTVKLKGKPSSDVLVHKSEVQRGGLRRTVSSSRTSGPQEPGQPHPGSPPRGDAGGEHDAVKTGSPLNGIGPSAALPPTGEPGPHHDGWSPWATTTLSTHAPQPFLDGGGTRGQDYVLADSEGPRVIGDGDSRAPSEAEGSVVPARDHVLQIPAPDYPHWGSASDSVDHEEDCLSKKHPEEEPQDGVRPGGGERGGNAKRSWGSLNEPVAADALSLHLKEDPAPAGPVGHPGRGWGSARGPGGGGSEDADVAEALAALEAATAGEDVDEAD